MQFVLNPNPLPLDSNSKKAEGIQYYQWQYKQKLLKEEQERNALANYLANLEKEEEAEQRNTSHPKRRAREEGTFYDYNLKWKKKIETKIEKEKVFKCEQMARKEEGSMRHEPKEDRKEMLKEYKGPVGGWQEHFESYIRNKSQGLTALPEEATFEPKINPKSKKIAEGMSGKVEDRLILFGEFLKMKLKEEEINKNNEEMGVGNKHSKYFSCSNAQEELFCRLFKEGEESLRKRKELPLDENHTFRPKLNKLPGEVEDKIMRKRKPLYYLKEEAKKNRSVGEVAKKEQKGNFESFLKRNEALLTMKKQLLEAMRQKIYQKQNQERSKCTFAPTLNSTSIRINRSIREASHELEGKKIEEIREEDQEPPMENIELSKVTLIEPRETSRFDDSDSLSGLREGQSAKTVTHHDRTSKRQGVFQTALTQQEGETEKQNSSSSPEKICEEDSIENMKNYEWETELEEIESHLQNMMSRVTK